MGVKKFRKGEVIFRAGDEAGCMYDIDWGRVGIYANYGTDAQKLLAELDSDDFFGEMGMIDHAPRSATAVALDNETTVSEITENDLLMLLDQKPAKVLMIMQQLSKQLRRLTNKYMEACKTASNLVKVEEKAAMDEQQLAEIRARVARYADELAGASDFA